MASNAHNIHVHTDTSTETGTGTDTDTNNTDRAERVVDHDDDHKSNASEDRMSDTDHERLLREFREPSKVTYATDA